MSSAESDPRRPFFGAASGALFAIAAVTEGVVLWVIEEGFVGPVTGADVLSQSIWTSPILAGLGCVIVPAMLGILCGFVGVIFESGRRLVGVFGIVGNVIMICTVAASIFSTEPPQPCSDDNQCISGQRIVCDKDRGVCVKPD